MDIRIKRSEIRLLPQAARKLSSLAVHARKAEDLGSRVGRQIGNRFGRRIKDRLEPVFAWLYTARRRLATLGVGVVTVWLFLHVMFGANGMVVYRQKRAEYQTLSGEINQLQRENDHYSGQIKALQSNPDTIEKEAREQLHYTRPGEVVYVSPAPPPVQIPVINSAQR
jgi:cell division protein FtsB